MTQTTGKDRVVEARCSHRFENGVEIIERETHYVSAPNFPAAKNATKTTPRLIIEDAISSATEFVSKTRAEVAGLNALLQSLVFPPIHSK